MKRVAARHDTMGDIPHRFDLIPLRKPAIGRPDARDIAGGNGWRRPRMIQSQNRNVAPFPQGRLTHPPIRTTIRLEGIAVAMQAFVASLTAFVLFIHTAVGCCWHHAHCSMPSVSMAAHCCHHHHHGDQNRQSENPCRDKVNCEGTCSYILPQKVKIEAPQWVAIDWLAVLPSLADCQIGARPSCEALASLPHPVLPLRTHLWHQVLLN